ncbi:hypothetical protein ACFQV8_35275 [Pseudonocardia benzenivorans]
MSPVITDISGWTSRVAQVRENDPIIRPVNGSTIGVPAHVRSSSSGL